VTPALCKKILSGVRHGRMHAVCDLQRRLMPLQACLSHDNPAALNYALSLLGLMHPATRLPIVELDTLAKAAVAIALAGIDEDQPAAADDCVFIARHAASWRLLDMDSQRSSLWHGRMVRGWHLAVLRFAVTRDNADRLGLYAVANEIDGCGAP
jgi:hypothetical protein